MRNIYVKGDFYPLNCDEIKAIRTIHKQNRDANIYLVFENRRFIDILSSFVKEYDYLFIAEDKADADIILDIHIPLDFNNIYKYYHRQIIVDNIELMKELISKKMSNKRFIHTLGVADEAYKLAKRYGYDKNKAYLAGLLHDICKEMSIQDMDSYLQYYDISKLDSDDKIKHGYVAKYYIKEKLGLYDKDILESIYHHTDASSNSLLTKIIYIADKREVNRHIDDEILKLAYLDINAAFLKLKRKVEEYINSAHK